MRSKSTSNIRFLNSEECSELFNTVENDTSIQAIRNRAIFYIAKYCALRVSEVALIELCDYDYVNKTIFIRRLKGSCSNTLKIIDPCVLSYFETYYWLRKSSPAFQHVKSNKIFLSQQGKPISRKTLDRLMKHYCANTSIPELKRHFHVLKHTRAMELIEYKSIELRDVQWWLGHKNIQNTMLYLAYTSTAMNALFEKLKLEEGFRKKEG